MVANSLSIEIWQRSTHLKSYLYTSPALHLESSYVKKVLKFYVRISSFSNIIPLDNKEDSEANPFVENKKQKKKTFQRSLVKIKACQSRVDDEYW